MDILFDLDGTLLDVSRRHYSVYREILSRWTRAPLPFADYWALKRTKTPLRDVLARSGAEDLLESFGRVWLELIERPDYLEMDSMVARARDVLERLRESHRLGLVTLRQSPGALARQLRSLRLDELFQAVLVAGDARTDTSSKARLIAAHQPPRGGWLVGDKEADIEAARALGLHSCAVTWGLRSRDFLRALRPEALADGVEEIPEVVSAPRQPTNAAGPIPSR